MNTKYLTKASLIAGIYLVLSLNSNSNGKS